MFLFFFNDTATTEIYTLSLHDALPISVGLDAIRNAEADARHIVLLSDGKARTGTRESYQRLLDDVLADRTDRKSTRLNSSHANISYAVFCLKKKKSSGRCRQRINKQYV